MKKIFYLSVLFIVASIITMAADNNELVKKFSVSKGGTLDIYRNAGGDVRIDTWDKNEVLVKTRGVDDEDDNTIKAYTKGNTVKIEDGNSWESGVDLFITIPSNFNVKCYTASGDIHIKTKIEGTVSLKTMAGEIDVNDIKGNTYLKSQGGDIRTKDIDGDVDINTMGGEIRAGVIKSSSPNINTMGGDIQIKEISGNGKIETLGGCIYLNKISGNSDVKTSGGDIEIQEAYGEISFTTFGGNISSKIASGSMEFSTSAGDLLLGKITGTVKAVTQSGNIYLELIPKNGGSSVSSSYGDIEFKIPADAKVEIDARINSFQGHMEEDNGIISDFKAEDSGNDKRSPNIKRTYILNGGGDRIKLKTTGESIRIKKITRN